MHSDIECEKKYFDDYNMIDWVSILRRARRRLPYRVIHFQHSDILDLHGLSQQTIDRLPNDVSFKNTRCAQWIVGGKGGAILFVGCV